MNKLHISPEARDDIRELRKYIREELDNPSAADQLSKKLTAAIRRLEEHAALGAPLSSIVEVQTDYRFLVCDSYLVFYYVRGKDIFVTRVLYGKRDYLRILFKDI